MTALMQGKMGRMPAVGVLLAAFYVRMRTIDMRALWFDEAIEFWVATAPLSAIHEMVATLTHDPPLYSYFIHMWQGAGHELLWLRIPALFFSVVGVAALIALGRKTLGRPAGLFAGVVVAFAAADVRYAQELGQYGPMTALLSLNLMALVAARRPGAPLPADGSARRSWEPWLWWGATAIIAIYVHYGSVLAIAVTSAVWLAQGVWRRDWEGVRRQVAVGIVAALTLAPLLFVVIPVQMDRFSALDVAVDPALFFHLSNQILLFQFLGNAFREWVTPGTTATLLTLPLWLLLGLALLKARSLTAWPVVLLVLWLTYFVLGVLSLFIFGGTRHSLLLTPLLMLTVGAGLMTLWRWRRAAALIVLMGIVVLTVAAPLEGQQDLRSVTAFWKSMRASDDVTYVYYGAVPAFRYHLLALDEGRQVGDVPANWYSRCWGGEAAPFCTEGRIYYGRWLRQLDAAEKAADVLATVGPAPQVLWIVTTHSSEEEVAGLLAALAPTYRVALAHEATNAAAFRLERVGE